VSSRGWKCYHVLFSNRVGGAENVAMNIAERLAQRGSLGGVFVAGDGPALAELQRRGLASSVFARDKILSKGVVTALLANAQLAWQLESWRRGVVHFHLPGLYRASRFAVGRSASVVHVHIDEPDEMFRWAFQQPPDLIVPCARFLEPKIRSALPSRYQESQRIEALPNAVDVERLAVYNVVDRSAAKRAVSAPLNRPLILMAANLAKHKGQETAIRAMARLRSLGADAELWLAGEDREQGGYERHLQELAVTEGVADRVRLLGFRSDVESLYGAADVLLLPSTREGLPLTVLEAQAAGVAVLAAPTAGVPEAIVDGETGWLIEHDDVEGYARRIKAVIDHPELRRAVSDRAFERVRKHNNWQDYCTRMIDLYESLLV